MIPPFSKGPLSWDDVETGKEYLRRKCLVGLVDQYEESISRFDTFFDFHPKRENVDNCIFDQRKGGGSNVHHHPLTILKGYDIVFLHRGIVQRTSSNVQFC